MLSRVVKTAQNGRSHYHRSFLLPPMPIFIQSFIHSFIHSFLGLYYFFPGVHILAILGLVPCTVMYTSGFYTTASFKMLNIKGPLHPCPCPSLRDSNISVSAHVTFPSKSQRYRQMKLLFL